MKKILELFAGSRSFSKVAKKMGFDIFTIDINNFDEISLIKDIEFIEKNDIPFIPDIIWASPPCTTYSIAAISTHRNGQIPKTEFAKKSDRLIKKTLEIIKWFPNAKFYIENPVGMLRKMDFMKGIERATVTYCQYGDKRMKPTDIWSNNIYSIFNRKGWQPKSKCHNNDSCHISAPRGSRTGTQGLKNNYEKSKVPIALCKEILLQN
ncbi:MAG: DNA cytosine methyltransferase [Bacteroidales bacterium]|nr:DNA cytosine methyltransferase [Bacteroidales bacterium]